MSKLRMVVADDHPIFLEGLSTIIELKYPDIELLAQATNGREAVEMVRKHEPDVALLDIRMPEMTGVDAAKEIREFNQAVKIIMLTTFNESELVAGALAAGINGYILKERSIPEVIDNIRSIVSGNLVLSSEVARHLIVQSGQKERTPHQPLAERKNLPEEISELSKRELEVLELMLRGNSNHSIATMLFLSERTVRNYVSKIYDCVSVHNRESLSLWAMEHELNSE